MINVKNSTTPVWKTNPRVAILTRCSPPLSCAPPRRADTATATACTSSASLTEPEAGSNASSSAAAATSDSAPWRLVSLAEAREGGDPLTERRRTRNMPTFAEAAEQVVEQKRSGWRYPRQAHDWMASLRRYAFPCIDRMPVSEVTSGDVLEILVPIWHVKARTARTVRQRMRTVLEWAVAMEYRTDNPCDRVVPVLGAQDAVVRHRPALPHREVGAAIRKVWTSNSAPVSMLAFEFLVLTAAR